MKARGEMGVAVDLCIFTVQHDRLELILIRMKRAPFEGSWALPGGRIRNRETVEQAAARELVEKTGLEKVFLEQLHTFSEPERDPRARCISVAHLALIPPTAQLRTTDKYSAIGWFPAERLPPLAFDHRALASHAVAQLRARLAFSNLAYSLLPPRFTLGELQRVYQAILGRRLDPRNFRKRIDALGLVQPTGELRGGAHRPARLFRFKVRRPIALAELA